MSRMAVWLQVVGTLTTAVGIGMWSVPGGVAFAGIATVLFGLAAERMNDAG